MDILFRLQIGSKNSFIASSKGTSSRGGDCGPFVDCFEDVLPLHEEIGMPGYVRSQAHVSNFIYPLIKIEFVRR